MESDRSMGPGWSGAWANLGLPRGTLGRMGERSPGRPSSSPASSGKGRESSDKGRPAPTGIDGAMTGWSWPSGYHHELEVSPWSFREGSQLGSNRDLGRGQERFDQDTPAAHGHRGEALVPVAGRHLGMGVEPNCYAGAIQSDRSCLLDLLAQILRRSLVAGLELARASLPPRLAQASASQSLPSQLNRPGLACGPKNGVHLTGRESNAGRHASRR